MEDIKLKAFWYDLDVRQDYAEERVLSDDGKTRNDYMLGVRDAYSEMKMALKEMIEGK